MGANQQPVIMNQIVEIKPYYQAHYTQESGAPMGFTTHQEQTTQPSDRQQTSTSPGLESSANSDFSSVHIPEETVEAKPTTVSAEPNSPKKIALRPCWETVAKDYELLKLVGTGSYGEVVRARHRASGRLVAIKLLSGIYKSFYECKKVLREIQILRHFTAMGEANQFATRLYDIIAPTDASEDLFLVLEVMETDLKKVLASTPELTLSEDHLTHLLYNMLCSRNFMHSANVVHRDVKPANLLVDQECKVKMCDFGLARTLNNKKSSVQQVEENTGRRLSRKELA